MIGLTTNMKKQLLLSLSVLAFFALFSSCNKEELKPNIVLITVDDLGWTDLGCFGSTYYETPNIDKLSENGIRFTNAYAACAVCSPTRAAIQTGRYPSRIGITNWISSEFQGGKIIDDKNPTGYRPVREGIRCPENNMFLEHDDVTIAEMLKTEGYVSCHIGKWHLGTEKWYPEMQGYDFNFGGCDYGQPPSYFDPYQNKKCENIPTLPARKKGEYLTDRETDEAIQFIQQNKNKPFFLNLCNYAVHVPIQAKDSLIKKYETKPVSNHTKPNYAAMLESVDDAVGAIIATLEKLDLDKNTLVIFTSDNGGLKGPTDNSPLRIGKGFPYEGGIRIPQIFYWPKKLEKGKVIETPVISMDIFSTIAEVTKAQLPDREIDGLSLWPLVKNNVSLDRESVIWHFPHFRGKIVPYSIIRAGSWKLIKRYCGEKEYELFNLSDDISEETDLSSQMPDKVKELNKLLVQALKNTNAKMPLKETNSQ
jgi:arylsulfatase A